MVTRVTQRSRYFTDHFFVKSVIFLDFLELGGDCLLLFLLPGKLLLSLPGSKTNKAKCLSQELQGKNIAIENKIIIIILIFMHPPRLSCLQQKGKLWPCV